MIRVLHVIGSMDCGGAETMIMNLYRCIDRTKIQFDFVLHSEKKSFYEKEIEELGGKIFRTSKYNVKNYFSYVKWWNEFLKKNEYGIVHGHINSSAAIYLSIAKKYGAQTFVHSHATKDTEHSLRKVAFSIMSYPIRYIADYFLACSEQAGKDRFGPKIVKSEKFCVLNNGIDSSKYIYNSSTRDRIRKKMNVSSQTYVIAHVGRFTFAKNHRFLVDVFSEVLKKEKDAVLWLFGMGELESEIKNKVEILNIKDRVIFWGVKPNIYEYLQAADVFVFPSLFEGLGIALIEAQAAGLSCIVSENIQDEADIGAGLVYKYNICDGSEIWANKVIDLKSSNRINTLSKLKDKGFDIQTSAELLSGLYIKYNMKK